MTDLVQKVTDRLKAFDENQDLEALMQASSLVNSIQIHDEQRRVLRREKLMLWLMVLDHIDKKIDPNFNPDDAPALTVAPPTTSGIVFDSGIDPKAIKDPKIRREYEEEIRKNNQRRELYTFQRKLSRLNERFSHEAETYIRSTYSKSLEDRNELITHFDQYVANEQRKEKLKKLITVDKQ